MLTHQIEKNILNYHKAKLLPQDIELHILTIPHPQPSLHHHLIPPPSSHLTSVHSLQESEQGVRGREQACEREGAKEWGRGAERARKKEGESVGSALVKNYIISFKKQTISSVTTMNSQNNFHMIDAISLNTNIPRGTTETLKFT